MSTRPQPPVATPLPIQRYQVTKQDFENPERFNVFLSQLTGAVQAVQGAGGPSVLPSGIDVAGGRVSGLGAPTHPSDAISSGHAQSQFSAETIGPQLDIGGKNALSGLTNLYLKVSQGISGTVPLAKITGGGANGSLTFANGIITGYVSPT